MNLRSLEYLVALKRHKHFGKAAQACFVSQPTLSMQIKKLEERLNVILLERSNKKVMLTPIGEDITTRAEQVLRDVKDIKELALTAQNPFAGELKLGLIPTLAPYLLPVILPKIQQQYPQLNIHLIEAQTDILCNLLNQGDIDGMILALPIDNTQFTQVPLFHEVFKLMIPNTHAFKNKKTISQTELEGQPLLLLDEGHCLRDHALEICKWPSNKADTNYRATSLETLKQMVAAGHGITLVPELASRDHLAGITYLEFQNPKPSREIGLVWRKTSIKLPVFKALTDFVKNIMAA